MAHADAERSRTWPPLAAGTLALLGWSIYAYLTERINGDMVAEAIQVQRLMADPQLVWSYPGQRHGGVLEYPLIALAESVSSGNVYGFTLLRILYVPVAGLLFGLAFRHAFPRRSLWPFAAAAGAGPAILHGMKMISDLFPMSFLLAAAAVWLAYRTWAKDRSSGWLLLAGVLAGLGIYEHPISALASIPLLLAGCARWAVPWRRLLWLPIGVAIGLVPQLLSLMQRDRVLVYNPTGLRVPDIPGILGLVPQADSWTTAMVPNGWGLQHADETLLGLPAWGQIAVNAALVGLLVVLIAPIWRALRTYREPATESQFLAVLWGAGLLATIGLVALVPPIWFYGTSLGFLMWWTVPLLPAVWARRSTGSIVAVVVVLLAAAVSLRAVALKEPVGLAGAEFKLQQARLVEQVAQQIADGGVQYVYGSYWEVLPIAYASAGRLQPITNTFNRFPPPTGERVTVAVPSGRIALPPRLPIWDLAEDARATVERECRMRNDLTALMPDEVVVADCPVAVLVPPGPQS